MKHWKVTGYLNIPYFFIEEAESEAKAIRQSEAWLKEHYLSSMKHPEWIEEGIRLKAEEVENETSVNR